MIGRTTLLVVLVGIGIGIAGATVTTSSARNEAAEALLPDFNITTPQGLLVRRTFEGGRARWKLGFISAAYNQGKGPAIVRGERSVREPGQMVAKQIVQRADGTTTTIPDVGRMRYDVEPTHAHWHLLKFMTYELRTITGYRLVRPDEKRGFCLADRYKVPRATFPGTPKAEVYTFDCAGKDPTAATVDEGMSIGWGDDYTQLRDGQQIDITGLKAGEYYLVHRVNASRRLKELDYRNNTSSIRVQIAWPGGPTRMPTAVVLAACTNTDRCRSGSYFDPLK